MPGRGGGTGGGSYGRACCRPAAAAPPQKAPTGSSKQPPPETCRSGRAERPLDRTEGRDLCGTPMGRDARKPEPAHNSECSSGRALRQLLHAERSQSENSMSGETIMVEGGG